MPTFKITLAYDGTDFVGWQRQADGPVHPGSCSKGALRDLDGRAVAVTGAGRTDAGVHALGQVAVVSRSNARCHAEAARARAERAVCPPAVRVLVGGRDAGLTSMPVSTRARRRTATASGTRAVLDPFERRYAWHLSGPAGYRRDGGGGADSRGQARFRRRFRPPEARSARPSARFEPPASHRDGSLVVVRGDRRRISPAHGAGHRRHAGRGRARPVAGRTTCAMSCRRRDRALAGPTAPAEGLFLVSVRVRRLIMA